MNIKNRKLTNTFNLFFKKHLKKKTSISYSSFQNEY